MALFIEISGLVGLLAFVFLWFSFPVERNRLMYGGKPFWAIAIISVFVVLVVLTLCFIGDLDETAKIVDWGNLNNSENNHTNTNDRWWAVISQFADPGNLPAASDKNGRIIAIISAISGIICLSGLFVSSIVNYLTKRSYKWRKGLIRYNRYGLRKYVVIIGCNEQTANIVKFSLKRAGVKKVLIQTRQDVEKMRMRLDLDLDKKEEERLVFYYAERTSREDIEALNLEKAREVYILGEDIDTVNEEDHDVFNISCLENVSEYLKSKKVKEKKKVHVNLEYQSTFTAFKSTNIYKSLDKNVEFLPFNIHEIWAKKILIDSFAVVPAGKKGEVRVQNYIPVDSFDGIGPNDDKTVHLVILGMNQMGTALGVQTALFAHFPNFHRDGNLRTTITFIDDQAKKEGEFFRGRFATMFELCRFREIDEKHDSFEEKEWFDPMEEGRYKHLGENFMDVQWEFIQGNVASDKVRKYLSDVAEDKSKITTVAICFNHPQRSAAAALYLPEMVYRRALQVLVYQQNSFDLANKVAVGEKVWKRYNKLRPFGMIEGSYTEDAFDNSMAKILHYLYANNKIGSGGREDGKEIAYEFEKMPDMSEYENVDVVFANKINNLWNQQGIVDKLSNMDMVDSIPVKLRSLRISVDEIETYEQKLCEGENLELMAKAEHSRWVAERVIMNFRPLDNVDAEWKLFAEMDADDKKRQKEKKYRKEKSRAHLDICSNTMLNKMDPGVYYNDISVICHIPQLLKYREWINIMRLADKKSRDSIIGKTLEDFVISKDKGRKEFALKLIKGDDGCYWMMETCVSQKQWISIMGNNPANNDEGPERNTKYIGDALPAVNVSKNDIEDFLKVLRKRTGLHFDLPTFAEWEFAAKNSFEEIIKRKDIKEVFRINKYKKKNAKGPWKITRKKKEQNNSLGIYNMLGNVWEWTKTEEPNNPGCYRFCGGSWRFRELHSDMRKNYWYSFWKPILKSDDIGFRLVWRFDVNDFGVDKTNGIKELLNNVARGSIEKKKENQKEAVERLIKMVPVETGYFVMGAEMCQEEGSMYPNNWIDTRAEREETPHHFVKISKFQISETPVTQELWNAVMGIEAKENPSDNLGDKNPQTNVSWKKIKYEFLPELNKITGKKYRLPREAEWEYVAKGGHKSKICMSLREIFENPQKTVEEKKNAAYEYLASVPPYPLYSGTNIPEDLDLHIRSATTSVKDKLPNELGVYDMSGNIWEWCEDFYQIDFYNDCIKGEGDIAAQGKGGEYATNGYITDPVCNDNSYAAHTFRGGSFRFDAKSCRSTSVNFWIDTDTDDDLGFRLALSEN